MIGTTLPIESAQISEVCGLRDKALGSMGEALEMIRAGQDAIKAAHAVGEKARSGHSFHMGDRSEDGAWKRIFNDMDCDVSLGVYRRWLDAAIWMRLFEQMRLTEVMDRTAKDKLYASLRSKDVPEVTEENARGMFSAMLSDADLIFKRGLARCFSDLDRRFKSHDGFKIGSRIILTNVFNGWGSWNYHSKMRETMADIERVFSILDGQSPDVGALERAIDADRGRSYGAQQSFTETPYFKIRIFKNGNAHLWMKRDDLVEKANRMLADYYGAIIPDACPDTDTPDDLRSRSGLPAKKLQFYPTPAPVSQEVLKGAWFSEESRVLEPSAGEGGITAALLEWQSDCSGRESWKIGRVDAIEIHPGRCAVLRELAATDRRLRVREANFLSVLPDPVYTHVVMNPPFYGTHWIEHVVHAFDFLAPGGTLIAILPVTAELGESKKHKAFRKWAGSVTRNLRFRDLPAESFAESGTRVSTVYLELQKPSR